MTRSAFKKLASQSQSLDKKDQSKPKVYEVWSQTTVWLALQKGKQNEDWVESNYRAIDSFVQLKKSLGSHTQLQTWVSMSLKEYQKEMLEQSLQQNEQILSTTERCAKANVALNTWDREFFLQYWMKYRDGNRAEQSISLGASQTWKKFTTFIKGSVDLIKNQDPKYDIQGGVLLSSKTSIQWKLAIWYNSATWFYPQIGIVKSLK